MVGILLVEDNPLIRETLSGLIAMEEDLSVLGGAGNGVEALRLLDEGMKPDVVLADLNMPEMDGIELTENLKARYSAVKVIILTMHVKATYLNRAIAAGAQGYLLKDGDLEELYKAIRKVHSGETYISGDIND